MIEQKTYEGKFFVTVDSGSKMRSEVRSFVGVDIVHIVFHDDAIWLIAHYF